MEFMDFNSAEIDAAIEALDVASPSCQARMLFIFRLWTTFSGEQAMKMTEQLCDGLQLMMDASIPPDHRNVLITLTFLEEAYEIAVRRLADKEAVNADTDSSPGRVGASTRKP